MFHLFVTLTLVSLLCVHGMTFDGRIIPGELYLTCEDASEPQDSLSEFRESPRCHGLTEEERVGLFQEKQKYLTEPDLKVRTGELVYEFELECPVPVELVRQLINAFLQDNPAMDKADMVTDVHEFRCVRCTKNAPCRAFYKYEVVLS